MKCTTGVYLTWNIVEPVAICGVLGCRTAMNNANTIGQPCEIWNTWTGCKLTSRFPPGPGVTYLRSSHNLMPRLRGRGYLVAKGQEVVVYPQTFRGGQEELYCFTRVTLSCLCGQLARKNYLINESRGVHQPRTLCGGKKRVQ